MTNQEILSASSAILKKAKQFGVHLGGFANVEDLKAAPSFVLAPQLPVVEKVLGTLAGEMELNPGEVKWPAEAKSILTVAVAHPEDRPELDWWYGQISPSGNKLLIRAVKALCDWIPANFAIDVFHFPYFIEHGGIYLKDAAVLAGLGCIGRNNMVVTPEFGPRVRLRAMALSVPIPSTGPSGFDPCVRCDDLCRRVCPQHAFDAPLDSPKNYNLGVLPGRDGCYARPTCYIQIRKDSDEAKAQVPEGCSESVKVLKFCRSCEWGCPVGK
ncbi:MAG: epoxyqueuosine reductase [Desulfobacterales bacterium]|nr:epoxyqueuosine reductase [Desulfobacterales bacterium]MDJ0885199.1 epoxyqueuosine reductase [Desulfobacterales bacterium]